MVKINRDAVLKNFLDKVVDAKRMNMKEVKIPMKELDELAYVIYQLMAEEVSKVLTFNEEHAKMPQQPTKEYDTVTSGGSW